MELIKDYMRDADCRHRLNDLTRKTFGFDFESWVTEGYFEGDYIPYSFMKDGKIVSNVSANRMNFMQNGALKNYIQLGTVMTDESYRRQGLAAELIGHVLKEYEPACDGIYLFGNLNALEFYRKMGFKTENQYTYFVKDAYCHDGKAKGSFRPVKDMSDEIKRRYPELVRGSVCHSSLEQINKYGLQMFYTAGLDNVYYSDDLDCFIVYEQDNGPVLRSILCKKKAALIDVVQRMELNGNTCRLGFVPLAEDMDLCFCEAYDGGDDYRLFYRGNELESIERDRLYFPDLSHA